ncbi:hypothetical protein ACMD2_26076, partial [Ananas comosus]
MELDDRRRSGAAAAAPPPPERAVRASRADSSRVLEYDPRSPVLLIFVFSVYHTKLRFLKEVGREISEDLVVLMPNLLSLLKHDDPAVVRQSIASGTILFGAVLEEMALQLNSSGRVDGWLEEMWSWMLQFKDRVQDIMMEPGSIATKLLALKFLETCVIYFTPQANDEELTLTEGFPFGCGGGGDEEQEEVEGGLGDKLLRALRALYPGEATEQLIRQVEKMSRSAERGSRDIR